MQAEAEFPSKLKPLFEKYRYKIAYGGRGGSKSWGVARALLIMGAQRKMRIGCFREVQKSIKESVHHLLSSQIQALGLGAHYDILETEIRGKNGTEFLFAGLKQHTVESVKSYEALDVVWVEEAQTVSKKSWDILIPTIRKPGSEIWVTFNPDLDTDDTYQRFVVSPPPSSVVIQINYNDNPWFSEELEQERLHCQQTRPNDYPVIWEGKCRRVVEGAIYADEIEQAIEQKRIRDVPYDPMLKVHTIWDLGWNDSMSIILVQAAASELRVIDFIEDSHKRLDQYIDVLEKRGYRYGKDFLPHDGRAKNIQTGKSAEEILRGLNRRVEIVPQTNIEEGIKAARMAFPRCYFDKERTKDLTEHLKRYKRAINATTNEPGAPLHDEHSHAADAFRYMSLSADKFRNDTFGGGAINYPKTGIC